MFIVPRCTASKLIPHQPRTQNSLLHFLAGRNLVTQVLHNFCRIYLEFGGSIEKSLLCNVPHNTILRPGRKSACARLCALESHTLTLFWLHPLHRARSHGAKETGPHGSCTTHFYTRLRTPETPELSAQKALSLFQGKGRKVLFLVRSTQGQTAQICSLGCPHMCAQGPLQCWMGQWVEIEEKLPKSQGGVTRELAVPFYILLWNSKESENAKFEPTLPKVYLSK